jgi:hypothetical protein
MRITVQCCTNPEGIELPVEIRMGDRTIGVKAVVDCWYGEDYDYFKLLADDGNAYLIKHWRLDGCWELTLYSSGAARMEQMLLDEII